MLGYTGAGAAAGAAFDLVQQGTGLGIDELTDGLAGQSAFDWSELALATTAGAALGGALGLASRSSLASNYRMQFPLTLSEQPVLSMNGFGAIRGLRSPIVSVGGPPPVVVNGNFFEVVSQAPIAGMTRLSHRASANSYLADQLRLYPSYAQDVNALLGHDVLRHMQSGAGRLRNPYGTEWHHPKTDPAVMWLLRRDVHRNPALQEYLHRYGSGGFAEHFGNP